MVHVAGEESRPLSLSRWTSKHTRSGGPATSKLVKVVGAGGRSLEDYLKMLPLARLGKGRGGGRVPSWWTQVTAAGQGAALPEHGAARAVQAVPSVPSPSAETRQRVQTDVPEGAGIPIEFRGKRGTFVAGRYPKQGPRVKGHVHVKGQPPMSLTRWAGEPCSYSAAKVVGTGGQSLKDYLDAREKTARTTLRAPERGAVVRQQQRPPVAPVPGGAGIPIEFKGKRATYVHGRAQLPSGRLIQGVVRVEGEEPMSLWGWGTQYHNNSYCNFDQVTVVGTGGQSLREFLDEWCSPDKHAAAPAPGLTSRDPRLRQRQQSPAEEPGSEGAFELVSALPEGAGGTKSKNLALQDLQPAPPPPEGAILIDFRGKRAFYDAEGIVTVRGKHFKGSVHVDGSLPMSLNAWTTKCTGNHSGTRDVMVVDADGQTKRSLRDVLDGLSEDEEDPTSQYRGLSWKKKKKQWEVAMSAMNVGKKSICLGFFD